MADYHDFKTSTDICLAEHSEPTLKIFKATKPEELPDVVAGTIRMFYRQGYFDAINAQKTTPVSYYIACFLIGVCMALIFS